MLRGKERFMAEGTGQIPEGPPRQGPQGSKIYLASESGRITGVHTITPETVRQAVRVEVGVSGEDLGKLNAYKELGKNPNKFHEENGAEPPKPPEKSLTPEDFPSAEDRESLPPFDKLVERLRQLEAKSTEETYALGPHPDNPYPVLREKELRYKQFEKYAEEMVTPEMAELESKLKHYSKLEEGLANGRTTVKKLLKVVESFGDDDPGIRGLNKKIEALEAIPNPTDSQSLALNTLRGQLQSGTDSQTMQKMIQKLTQELAGKPNKQEAEQKIAVLKGKVGLNEAEEAELSESEGLVRGYKILESEQKRFEDFQHYSGPNKLVGRLKELRSDPNWETDPAKQAQVKEALTQILREEKAQVESEIGLKETVAYEKLIRRELKQPGKEERKEWEANAEESARLKEAEAEKIEVFDSLPPFMQVVRDYEAAKRNGDNVVLELAEARIERYLYHASNLQITAEVCTAFDEIYSKFRIPYIHYYGDIIRVAKAEGERGVLEFAGDGARSFGDDERVHYETFGWDFNKFGGIIGFVANRAGQRMRFRLAKAENPKLPDAPNLKFLQGEWNENKAARKVTSELLSRLFWEKSYAGYYQIKIDTDIKKNPLAREQLLLVADQWINYMQSGVVPKNPQEQMKEWQMFVGQWAPIAEKIFRQIYPEDPDHPEDIGRALKEVTLLRQQLKFRVEAPIAAYFNAIDDADNFAAMQQNMFDEVEAPEVFRQGYGALEGMVAYVLHKAERDPLFAELIFQPQGSKGYLSANNAAQRLLETSTWDQLEKEVAQWRISDRVVGNGTRVNELNSKIAQLQTEIASASGSQRELLEGKLKELTDERDIFAKINTTDYLDKSIAEKQAKIAAIGTDSNQEDQKKTLEKELAGLIEERKALSLVIRQEKQKRIGLDQSEEEFKALYAKLEEQADYKLLSPAEQSRVRKERAVRAKAAIIAAKEILNFTGQISARGGPTIEIRDSRLLVKDHRIEKLNEMIADLDALEAIPQEKRTAEQNAILDLIKRRKWNRTSLNTELEKTRTERERIAKELFTSDNALERRPDKVPVRTVVRVAQYAVYRAEEVWAKEADQIMKHPTWDEQKKEEEIQKLCLAIIPDAWNLKKGQKLNLSDVLEGVYRDAMDQVLGDWTVGQDGFLVNRVVGKGFQATLQVPDGKPLYVREIDRLPEAGGMLMNYYGTEEIMTNTISLPSRVAEAKAGRGGLMGRALRILDPAFNRFTLPEYERNFQGLQRALHAGIEANWQRHFQIKIEVLERSIIGADIRNKNKTGRKEDRYKIIDGNPRNNLLEFGREKLYVTGRIINHGAEVLTHSDRRSRRAPDLGLYSPMQHESMYDEAAVEDSREFIGLIDTMSDVESSRGLGRLDFLFLKLKGGRWGFGYKQRVALESGPVEGGKQWTGLLEKIWANGDRNNKMWDSWMRSRRGLTELGGYKALGDAELKILNETADAEYEDWISTAEGTYERLKLSMESLYPDLSYYRLAQAPLWKDGVDPFLPDGTLNFERLELGRDRTLLGSDNGTSRHTAGVWFERENQWKMDPRKGQRWYPGLAEISKLLNEKHFMLGTKQSASEVLKGRLVR